MVWHPRLASDPAHVWLREVIRGIGAELRRPAQKRAARSDSSAKVQATPVTTPPRIEIAPEARRAMIAESAYLRSERRGFAPGFELEDWLSAEVEVDALLAADHGAAPQ